jgi:hypothetical protein
MDKCTFCAGGPEADGFALKASLKEALIYMNFQRQYAENARLAGAVREERYREVPLRKF